MKYILTSVTSGGAATVCRQHQHETGYEIRYRQLTQQVLDPVGTRSMGYWILDKAIEANTGSKQLRGELLTLGVELTRFEKDNSTYTARSER